jgi:hypothetical protein
MFNSFLKTLLLNMTLWKNIATYDNILRRMRIECWIPKATNTLGIHNIYWFSTATTIARAGLIVTLSVRTLTVVFNPLTPELNPSAQRCLTRFFTGDFASWTVHFVNICVKNQQIHQLFIQFINYVCHRQGAFLVPSDRCLIEELSIEHCH